MTEVAEGQEQQDDHVDRRGFLRKLLGRGAVAAAGVGAASALLAEPAAATDPYDIAMNMTNVAPTTVATGLNGSPFQVTNTAGISRAVTGSVTDPNAIALEATSSAGAAARVVPRGDLNPLTNFPPTTGTWSAGSVLADVNGDFWYCYLGGPGAASGWYPLSLVPAFIPIAPPARIYDSRPGVPPLAVPKGTLGNAQERDIDTAPDVPVTAFAVLINLIVTDTVGTGFMAVFSADDTYAGTSNIVWYGAGQILANNATTGTDLNGKFTVRGGGTAANFAIDALGFYTLTF